MKRAWMMVIAIGCFAIAPSIAQSEQPVTKEVTQAQKDLAKTNILTLTSAAKAYFIKYSEYPKNLAHLAEPPDGSRPFIEPGKKLLQDPWGKDYQFEVKVENNINVIKIWTIAPDGTRIDNMPKK
jgi:hypothetical protein